MTTIYIPGLEISNFMITKSRFRTSQVQETYFENGFCEENVFFNSQYS